jgi:hypothetical protein
MDWIESIWQLCVEKVDEFDPDDDWKQGHNLLKYIVNVAFTLHTRHSSPRLPPEILYIVEY